MSELLLPTAANARLLAKRPTTAVSTELNNCCKMLLAASGRAKSSNLFHRDPCVISIVFFFCIFIVKQIPSLISTDDYNPGKSENQ